jgi:IS30 family transposase
MYEQGYSNTEIAIAIGKHKSTIGRELKRNSDRRSGRYRAELAQEKYNNRQKEKPKAIKFDLATMLYVEKKLEEKWSPEQISKTPHPEHIATVSHERIYQHIIWDRHQGGNLYKHLRRRKRYKKRCVKEDRRGKLSNIKPIKDRPVQANERTRIGDYEVDLIMGANHQGGLVSLNDRKTGVITLELVKTKNARVVAKKIIKALKGAKHPVYTITSDNGKEFADHEYISKKLGIDFYFADPYSSWQRGSNENLNGLVRQYFPKKTNFEDVSWHQVKKVQDQLNNRPRKRYDFKSPLQYFDSLTEVAFVT